MNEAAPDYKSLMVFGYEIRVYKNDDPRPGTIILTRLDRNRVHLTDISHDDTQSIGKTIFVDRLIPAGTWDKSKMFIDQYNTLLKAYRAEKV